MPLKNNGIALTNVPIITFGNKALLAFVHFLVIPRLVRANFESYSIASLNEADFANAEKLSKEELYRELSQEQKMWIYRSDIRSTQPPRYHRAKRNGVSRPQKLWPNARIPYMISSHYTPHERALLAKAVKQYHDRTCVRFMPRSLADNDYLFIGKVDGCFSEVGRTNGVQVLSLDNGCMDYSTIIHEIMHVVGFYHEHERWDRDQYIDIIWQNIDKSALDQFGKMDLSKTSYYGQPYDYKSILHYDSLAFSKNGFPTMLPKKSVIYLAKINRMYKCSEVVRPPPPPSPLSPALESISSSTQLPPPAPTKAQISAQPIYYPLKTGFGSGGQPPHQATFYGNAKDGGHSGVAVATVEDGGSSSVNNGKAAVCEDRITVCWWTQDRCFATSIYHIMKTLCPKTCRFC